MNIKNKCFSRKTILSYVQKILLESAFSLASKFMVFFFNYKKSIYLMANKVYDHAT